MFAQTQKRDTIRKDTTTIPEKKITKYTLKGIVTGETDDETLPGAHIYVGEDKKPTTVTNAMGEFTLKDLLPGELVITVSFVGYQATSKKYLVKADTNVGIIKLLPEELDEVVIIYTKMLNGVQTETETRHLLPLEKEHFNKNVPVGVQMEQLAMVPSAEALMENIIPIYIQGFVYGALVESYASEHNLRMLAMQSATDSASAMLNDLSIQYNRVRQAAITQEITEVVSGAKAQKRKKKR